MFKDAIKLSAKIAYYVPSTVDKDKPTNNAGQVERVKRDLSAMFGGATATQVAGSWIDDNGTLIQEAITIVYSNATPEAIQDHADELEAIAKRIKEDMRQDAVSVELNGVLYIV